MKFTQLLLAGALIALSNAVLISRERAGTLAEFDSQIATNGASTYNGYAQ
jgi:hypothetical protein